MRCTMEETSRDSRALRSLDVREWDVLVLEVDSLSPKSDIIQIHQGKPCPFAAADATNLM